MNVQRHTDRVSISFCDDVPDVDFIISVTFDNRLIDGLDDQTIIAIARKKINDIAH